MLFFLKELIRIISVQESGKGETKWLLQWAESVI